MSEVDERVVKMSFDNDNFEKNAKETMSTLDKLKQALNFDKTEKSFEKITEAANKVDVSNIANSVDAIQAKFSVMQVVAYSAISNITNRLMNFAHGIVSGMWASTVQGGINRAFKVEKAKFNIQGLGKDWTKISEDINEAVKGTAYGFDEAAAAAASLAASDVSAKGKNSPMLKGLKAIAGAAAMTGSSFSDISNIFTTVAGNGRILSQQLNQFSARGLNAAATLRDYVNAHEDVKKKLIDAGMLSTQAKKVEEFAGNLKLTEGNIRTLVSASVVDFKTFSDAMSDAFGDQAKKADKTFSGVLANVKAALARIGQAFAQPLIANNDMDAMLEFVDTPLRKAINKAKENAAEGKDAYKAFLEELRNTPKYANVSNKTAKKMFETYYSLQNNLVGVLQGVKKVFLALETAVKNSSFLQSFIKVADKGCQILTLAFTTLAAAFTNVEKSVKGVKKQVRGVEIFGKHRHVIEYKDLVEKLGQAIGIVGEDFDNLKDTVKGVLDIFKLAWYVVTEFIKAFIPAKSSFEGMGSSILEVTGFVGRFLTAFSEWVRESGIVITAANAIRNVISLLIAPFRIVVNFIGGFFKSIRKGTNPLAKFVTSVKELWKTIKTTFGTIIDAGKNVLKAFFEPFLENGKKLSSDGGILGKVLTILAGAAIVVSQGLKTAGVAIYNFITKFISVDKAKVAGQKFHDFIMDKFVPAIKAAFDWCKKFVSGSFGKVGNIFKGIWDSIKNAKVFDFTSLFSGGDKVTGNVTNIKDNIVESFKDFSLKDFLLNKLEEIRNIDFSEFVEKFKNGIDSFLEFLDEAKVKIGESIQNLKKALTDKGVDFKSFGDKIAKGFETTFEVVVDLGPKVILAISKLFTSMVDTIKKALPKPSEVGFFIGTFITNVIENIVSLIPWVVETLGFTIRTIAGRLPEIFGSLAVQLREALDRALFEPFVVGTGEYQKEIPPLFNLITDTVKAALDHVAEEIKGYTLDDFLNVLKKIVSIDLLKNFSKLIKSNSRLVNDFGKMLEDLLGTFEKSYSKYLKDEGKAHKLKEMAGLLKSIAIAIGVLALALLVFGYVPQENLEKGMTVLGGIILQLSFLIGVIAAINKYLAKDNLDKVAVGLAQLTGAIAALGAVIIAMSFVQEDKLQKAIVVMAELMTELGVFIYAIKKIEPEAESMVATGTAIAEIAGAIGGLTASIIFLGMMPRKQLDQGLKALGTVMLGLIGTFAIMNKLIKAGSTVSFKDLLSIAPILLALGGIMLALWAIKKFELDPSQLKWIDATLIVLAGIVLVFDKTKLSVGAIKAAAIGAVAIAAFVDILVVNMIAIALALGGLSKIPEVHELINGGGQLLKEIGNMFSQFIVGFADGVAEAMNALNKVNVPDEKIETVGKVAEVLKNLAKVQAILTKNGGLMTFFAGDQPFTKFGNGVTKLFESFKEVGEAAGKVPNIDKIKEITGIAKSLSEMVAAIKDPKALGEVLNLVGENKLAKLGKELIKFAEDANTATGKFSNIDTSGMKEAAADIASSVKSIAKALPKEGLQSTGSNAVDSIKSGVKGGGKEIASQLGKELTNAVNSISTDRFKTKGESFIKVFIAGMDAQKKELKKDAKKIAQSAADAMDDNNIKNDARTAGENVVKGFRDGIGKEYLKAQIAAIAKKIGKLAVDKIKEGANEASPSKDADKAGQFIDVGFINGMSKLIGKVATTASNVGRTAVNNLRLAMSEAENSFGSSISSPVIRPVMDLSNIKMGADSIGAMLNRNRYALNIAGDLQARGLNATRNISVTNNITVSEGMNGKEFADEFMQELEIQARTV